MEDKEGMENRRVALIDLSSLFWTSWHAIGEKSPGEAFRATIDSVNRCARDADLVAVCCDMGSTKRKALLPSYKANRPEKDAVAVEQLRLVKERLETDGRLLWGVEGYEADDVIAAAAKAAPDRGHSVLVCTSDKDLLQLLSSDNVRVMRTYNTWETWDAVKVREKFGIEPVQIPEWLALVGDASDNIKGADGIGSKTAAELLRTYTDVEGIYQALKADPTKVLPLKGGGISKAAQSLIACENQVRLALKLVRLDPPPLAFEQIYERREQKPLTKETDMHGTVVEGIEDAEFEEKEPAPAEEAPKTAPGEAPAQTVAIATKDVVSTLATPVQFERGLEPRSMREAIDLSKYLYDSRMYSRFPNPQAILAVMLRGRALGLCGAESLDVFHFFEGKPVPHARFIIGLFEKDPNCEYLMLTEATDTKATAEGKHRKHKAPFSLTYTIDDARKAGLVRSGSNWEKRPGVMLRKTVKVLTGRELWPLAGMGLYCAEELGGDGE